MKIKANLQVKDLRLSRIRQFDERSRKYPIRALISGKPRSYTWPCDKVLDQGNEGACFPPGTYVRMADGSQKRIEQILLLDEVVTAEGRIGVVLQTMARHYEGVLLGVKLRGHHPVKCTPDHPFLTDHGYVRAQDLREGDYVAVPRYTPLSRSALGTNLGPHTKFRGTLSGEVCTGGVISKVTPLPVSVSYTYPLGRILGLYAAEGNTTENKVVWTFGCHERDTLVPELITLLREVLSIEARTQTRPNGSINVVVYGKCWRLLFSKLVPGTSKHGDKHLSSHLTSGGSEFLAGLLDGWLSGDGHRRRTSAEGITVCHRMALDMHAIANALGKRPTINVSPPSVNDHAKTRQNRWSITLPEGDGQNLMRQTDTAVWRKFMGFDEEPYCGFVFNLHVRGDESYVAEGLGVHNCVGFSVSHELIARPVVVPGITGKFAVEKIYWEAQKIDPWNGGSYPGASPRYEGTSVLCGVKVVQKLGYIEEYRWAFGLDDLILAVGHCGPAVLGLNWYEGMFEPASCGFLHVTGELAGGHAILCRGVNVRQRYFVLHNSWGPDWGDEGTAKITFEEMDRLLKEDGEAVIPTKRSKVQ